MIAYLDFNRFPQNSVEADSDFRDLRCQLFNSIISGKHFIASNNSVISFQLVIESIVILHSEGAQVAPASLQTFADGDQAAS